MNQVKFSTATISEFADQYAAQDFEALADGDVISFSYSEQSGNVILQFASINVHP